MILDLIQERAHLKTYDDAKEVVWALYYTKYNRYTQWIIERTIPKIVFLNSSMNSCISNLFNISLEENDKEIQKQFLDKW